MATNGRWLLFKGGFINFRQISHGAIKKNSNTKDWFMKAVLQVIEI